MIDWKIDFIAQTSSTNEDLLQKLSKNSDLLEGSGIRTDFQTHGKGQIGNFWESEVQKNLLLSFLLKPSLKTKNQFAICQLISLSIVTLLEEIGIQNVSIKWPNDIYVRDLKIAGMLIHNQISGYSITSSVIGIGLNINQIVFDHRLPNPCSIKSWTNMNYDLVKIQNQLLERINEMYGLLNYLPILHKNYCKYLFRKDKLSPFFVDRKVIEGKIKSVAPNGKLIITINNMDKSFLFKEIKFII